MIITRHFVDVGQRRVHYRRCGEGPPLLMVHQSPRSSAEYEPLMRQWGASFTCIAPDTPGFGLSDPLLGEPDIDAFADALVDMLDALGLGQVGAYGFHSGGIILVTALKRHPRRFSALAVGGYAIWTPEEMAIFGDKYLPPFQPSGYGEHLTWLWNRVLEQSWFFPWFDVREEARLSVAHADPARIDAVVREMLDAGDAYRAGYGAVLRAPRDIPPPHAVTPPVLITAYDGDPLQAHIDRLGAMPIGWAARKVATPAEHHAASLDFLRRHPAPPLSPLAEAANEGFARIAGGGFDGAVHSRGTPGGRLILHAPGESLERVEADGLAIDLPGHGLSDPWNGDDWAAFVAAAAEHFGCSEIVWPVVPQGDPQRLFPELRPDRFGNYLATAWSIVRARVMFDPWYEAAAPHARAFDPAELAPERLAVAHRALLRATAAKDYLHFLRSREKTDGNS
jgi:pimeloyl-ACP methyl ester carboxylesterase